MDTRAHPREGRCGKARVSFTPDRPCLVAACAGRCLDRGFAIDEIAVISLRGRERSALLQADRLGPWALRRFTGGYDDDGGPIWTEGKLLVESVRRFKGQTTSCRTRRAKRTRTQRLLELRADFLTPWCCSCTAPPPGRTLDAIYQQSCARRIV